MLNTIVLKVKDPGILASFYCHVLGMKRLELGDKVAVGYGRKGAALVLEPALKGPRYQHKSNDRYWKIAITLPNLDLAYASLARLGVHATEPHQFREIAYMSHLSDPEGHIIELLQHTFEGNTRTSEGDDTLPLGGGAEIGLVTLRTHDIEAEKNFCLNECGMRFLSRQTVSDRGFDLYFFAPTNEVQPHHDIDSVGNREWLWQRPYTTLEFQHLLNSEPPKQKDKDQLGAFSISIKDGSKPIVTIL